jgi:hypothetical protein
MNILKRITWKEESGWRTRDFRGHLDRLLLMVSSGLLYFLEEGRRGDFVNFC